MITTAHIEAATCFRTALLAALNRALTVENARRTKPFPSFWEMVKEDEGLKRGKDLHRKLRRALSGLENAAFAMTSDALDDIVENVLRGRISDAECWELTIKHSVFINEMWSAVVAEGMLEGLFAQAKGREFLGDLPALADEIRTLLVAPGKWTVARKTIALMSELSSVRLSDLGLRDAYQANELLCETYWVGICDACERGDFGAALELRQILDRAEFVKLWARGDLDLICSQRGKDDCKEVNQRNANVSWKQRSAQEGVDMVFGNPIDQTGIVLLLNQNWKEWSHFLDDFLQKRGQGLPLDLATGMRSEASARTLCHSAKMIDRSVCAVGRDGSAFFDSLLHKAGRSIEFLLGSREHAAESRHWADRHVSCVSALATVRLNQNEPNEAGKLLDDGLEILKSKEVTSRPIWADWYMLAGRYFKAIGLSDRNALKRASQVYRALGNGIAADQKAADAKKRLLEGLPGFQGSDSMIARKLFQFVEDEEPPCLSGAKKSRNPAERKGRPKKP